MASANRETDLLHFHRLQVARARQFLRAHANEQVTLESVARAAGASPFHFSRLYHAVARETVFETLTRIRLQNAARLLSRSPTLAVSHVALAVGYATPSSFTKAFRGAFGVSPSKLRDGAPKTREQILRRVEKRARLEPTRRALRISREPTMRTLAPRRFFYVRELGPYTEVAPIAWSKLVAQLARADAPVTCVEYVGASFDDPGIVSEELLRYDAGVVVPAGVAGLAGTHEGVLEGGSHAVFEYRGSHRGIADAFAAIFRSWAPRSEVRLRKAPCLEIYRNDPACTPEDELVTELLVPMELGR